MTAEIEEHLRDRLLPAGLAPVVEEAISLLLADGWDHADTLVTIPAGTIRVEAALAMDDGAQIIRVIDLCRAFELLRLLPPELNWIERHPSWKR